ncbi:MAG: PQQ-binding-like beta-propeller repeat protein [Deltaproteobacteria bacterium]|nr:PQQ-binding-like beta-propeller repeat protein [Deltaproteobacteria bacterium]
MRARGFGERVHRPATGWALAFLCVAAGCSGAGRLALTSDDNNPAAIARALSSQEQRLATRPGKGIANSSGRPVAFLVAQGSPRNLIAWDLSEGKALWTVAADVTSRVVVGSSFAAYREGKANIVAREVGNGKVRWSHALGARTTFLGLAADGDHAFYVVQEDGARRAWHLVALKDGKEAWRQDAPGTLGTPTASGGLVFVPFMTQWLTIFDAETGAQVARIRQDDEAVTYVRATSDGVFYGSRGIFLLDENSAAGKKTGATYGMAKFPEFVRPSYHFDAFKSVQAEYSAYDRNRVLWRAAKQDGRLVFRDNTAVVFTYRFFFGFDAETGELKWAHDHPRFDVVSAEHVGPSVLYVSQEGEIGALDPVNGSRLFETKVGSRILGATFDADGFRPAGASEPTSTRAALESIVWNKDARFGSQKLFAVTILGGMPGNEVASALIRIIGDENLPAPVVQKAGDLLVARKDEGALPLLVDALTVKHDYITGSRPRGVDVIARAIAGIGKPEAVPVLVAVLEAPETDPVHLKDVVQALAACKGSDAVSALSKFLLMYRADPTFASDPAPLSGAVDALLAGGREAERELVAYVEGDPRTQPKLAEYARRALAERKNNGQPGER